MMTLTIRWIVRGLLGLAIIGADAACKDSSAGNEPRRGDGGALAEPKLALSKAALDGNPIATAKVTRGRLAADLQVVGSVSYDQDHYAVVGPLVDGRVVRLQARTGDTVRAGEVLAEIESSDVGQAQAAYLSARARARAADANLKREEELAAQKISSEREREMAEAQSISESAEKEAAIERLRAYGLGGSEIEAMKGGKSSAGRLPLRSPIAGTVIDRHVTLGQAVERADDAFKIANLTHLWVNLDLYEKDLSRVHIGQKVELRTEMYPGEMFAARVAYVNAVIDEKTRTANVRIEFDNPKGRLRPGQFVTARLLGDPSHTETNEVLVAPRRAIQSIEGKTIVFVRSSAGFERRLVEVGLSGMDQIEVRSGLKEGEEIATDGAFLLKSELLR